MMRPPGFWQTGAWPAAWLDPLGSITAGQTARRLRRPGWQPPVPVFCAGNATMGGAGKTSVALDLGQRLRAAGRAVHFLSRGYGGQLRGPLLVDPRRHDARLVGDEPLLLAAVAPCWVGADRAATARAALAAGAQVLVMDDGLQNPDIGARHNALVIDGAGGFGNGRLFPAGPLREHPAVAARRCEIAVLIGPDLCQALAALPPALPVLRARLVSTNGQAVAGRLVHGFAGIARPDKFFASLTEAGAVLGQRRAFPDHQPYARRVIDRLLAEASRAGALLVTTAKDAARLPPDLRPCVTVLGVALDWEQPQAVDAWLRGP